MLLKLLFSINVADPNCNNSEIRIQDLAHPYPDPACKK